MFISECLAYEDITAELRQYKNNFMITLSGGNGIEISLTLNYLQMKVLSDGIRAMVTQSQLKEFQESDTSNILGDITVMLDIAQAEEVCNENGEGAICQPDILPALTDEASLSKIA